MSCDAPNSTVWRWARQAHACMSCIGGLTLIVLSHYKLLASRRRQYVENNSAIGDESGTSLLETQIGASRLVATINGIEVASASPPITACLPSIRRAFVASITSSIRGRARGNVMRLPRLFLLQQSACHLPAQARLKYHVLHD